MAASTRNNNATTHTVSMLVAACSLTAPFAAPLLAAETPTLGRTFAWSADVLNSDFRSDTLDLSGNVRVTQGPMAIEAGAAKAKDFRSENSHWTFEQDVHIRTAEADLHADTASAAFNDGVIASARILGSPAQFEQRGEQADEQVRGRAGVIEYDFRAGIVKLTNQVWFSNGKDEFRGDVVIYNVRDERVQINPGGQSGNRVRGIIRPNSSPGARPQAPVQPDSAREKSGDAAPEQRTAPESGA